ncbi:ATP-binding protein [Streptomyces sp. NPDC005474]|uniref:ATP-binding protein n=1 Tax=Streptomyces sp. NPDC005474 TaxID=3154878 RepID=UPI0034544401
MLYRADGGEGRLVVVEGDAGIGKTRLVDSFTRTAAERGLRVPVGVAGQGETTVTVVEDLHWADGATRDLLLAFLARVLRKDAVLLVVTELVPGPLLHGGTARRRWRNRPPSSNPERRGCTPASPGWDRPPDRCCVRPGRRRPGPRDRRRGGALLRKDGALHPEPADPPAGLL